MSESYASPDDSFETSSAFAMVDMLHSESWPLFQAEVQSVEASAVIYGDTDISDRIIDDYAPALEASLGVEGDVTCHFMGLAYPVLDNGQAGASELLSTENATYSGCDVPCINGRRRAVISLEVSVPTLVSNDDDDQSFPVVYEMSQPSYYYVIPDSQNIMALGMKCSPDDFEEEVSTENIQARFSSVVERAQQLVMSPDFLSATPEDQKKALRMVLLDAENYFLACGLSRRETLEFFGSQYYAIHDDLADFDPMYSYVKADDRDSGGRMLGVFSQFDYPELEDVPDGVQLRADHFTMNGGAPCLIVRCDEKKTTYKILPQSVTNII